MASIDFISSNCEHCKKGPLTIERAEKIFEEEKRYAESRDKKTRVYYNPKGEKVLDIEEHDPGWISHHYVVLNYENNSTYSRCV